MQAFLRRRAEVGRLLIAAMACTLVSVTPACRTFDADDRSKASAAEPIRISDGASRVRIGAEPWGLNDVSFLFPLPATAATDKLLRLSDVGERGPLFDAVAFAAMPFRVSESKFNKDIYPNLRVIAVRLDPCGESSGALDAVDCQPQIRLSAQPVEVEGGALLTVDEAVHLVYVLSATEFTGLIGDLTKLRSDFGGPAPDAPLGVHPMLTDPQGAFAEGFRKVVLRYAGWSNLHRVTAMLLTRHGEKWIFSNGIRNAAAIETQAVPTMTSAAVLVMQGGRRFGRLDTMLFSGANTSTSPDAVREEWGKTSLIARMPAAEVTHALETFSRLQNPEKHSFQTIDCGGCHVSTTHLEHMRRYLGVEILPTAGAYKMPAVFDASRLDETGNTVRNVRAFGYLERDVAISQRVINESARVAEFLNIKDGVTLPVAKFEPILRWWLSNADAEALFEGFESPATTSAFGATSFSLLAGKHVTKTATISCIVAGDGVPSCSRTGGNAAYGARVSEALYAILRAPAGRPFSVRKPTSSAEPIEGKVTCLHTKAALFETENPTDDKFPSDNFQCFKGA